MPSFHVNNLKKYMEVFNRNALEFTEKLGRHVGADEFDFGCYISETTMNAFLGI